MVKIHEDYLNICKLLTSQKEKRFFHYLKDIHSDSFNVSNI